MTQAVDALAALANESRLSIYRLLVEAGPQGRAANRDTRRQRCGDALHLAQQAPFAGSARAALRVSLP